MQQKPKPQVHLQQHEESSKNVQKQTLTEQEKKAIQHVSFEETNPPRNNKTKQVPENQNLNRTRNIAEE